MDLPRVLPDDRFILMLIPKRHLALDQSKTSLRIHDQHTVVQALLLVEASLLNLNQ